MFQLCYAYEDRGRLTLWKM